MIAAQSLMTLFQQALKEKWGYIWGTAGEEWTAAKQKALERTTDPERAQGREYGSKWIGHRVADCSGLFSWAFRQLGGTMYHGSDTMYRKYCVNRGELKRGNRTDGGILKPGTAVFVWNGRTYSHVGLYAGDGKVIEAMGTASGVTTSPVTAGKWTHWGELAGIGYADPAPDSPARETLRRGSRGTAVSDMQTLLQGLGYDLGSYGADGDFGKDTEAAVKSFQKDHRLTADGICGPATWAELKKAGIPQAAGPAGKTWQVTISGLDRGKAEEIADRYGGEMTEG